MKIELEFKDEEEFNEFYWTLNSYKYQLEDKQKEAHYMVQLLTGNTSSAFNQKDLDWHARGLNIVTTDIQAVSTVLDQLNPYLQQIIHKSLEDQKKKSKKGGK